jgi:S-DNA-T family DNA segregation ATPase FtsK/SpoIIIE
VASAKLRIGHADGRVEERELGAGSYRIGREDADIVLPDASVSARHAVLEVNALGVVIQDVGSRNGTSNASGQRISSPYTLLPEQPVRLGKATLTLLRTPGQAGGTRAMPEMPRPGRTRVMAEVPAPFAVPPVERGALPATAKAPPPGIGGWLKLLGAALVMLLGFVSLKTCSALVEAVSQEPESKQPAQKAPTKAPASKRPTNERAPRAR